MQKKIKQIIKKHIIAIWITVTAIALTTIGVLASYTNQQNIAKNVVATASNAEMRFSSNYLEESTPFKTIVINPGDSIKVEIRNYGRESTIPYSSDIHYTLTAKLVNSSGVLLSESQVQELMNDDEDVIINSVTITEEEGVETETESELFRLDHSTISDDSNETLSGGTSADIDHFNIYFPSPSSKIYVMLVATPDDSYKDLNEISAIFAVSDKSSIQNSGWVGQFNDSTATSVSGYDAFNYVITGSGNSTTATIKWDSSVISINQLYLNSKMSAGSVTDVSGRTGWKQVTVVLNTTASSGRYSFQVFKTASFSTRITSWDALKTCIEFDDGI